MITTLTDYFREYGEILLQTATERTRPLHTPGKDPEVKLNLLRPPKRGQHARITASVKSLHESKCVQLACATGTGKTLLSIATCEGHANGKPYRAMVVCPPHLVKKWKREIEETVPGVYVAIVEHYSQLTALRRTLPCNKTMWLVMSSTMAKLGCETKPAIKVWDHHVAGGKRRKTTIRIKDVVYCPSCNAEQYKIDSKTGNKEYLEADVFRKQELPCCECGEQLWQWTRGKSGLDRWPIAKYINKRLRHYFHYGIFDESHKAKADDTEIGDAFSHMTSACQNSIALTGTLLGGLAWHARTLLYRIRPCTLVEEGMGWDDVSSFNERYGRFESTIVTRNKLSNRMYGKTGKSKTVRNLRPGIMPQLFGRHLMPFCVFLNLEDISQDLPPTSETVIECDMDAELAGEYYRIESAIKAVIMEALLAGDRSILSNMLHTLLGYPDLSTGWDTIHMKYKEADEILAREVVTPRALNQNVVRNKEQELIDAVLAQRDRGRKVWIYTTMVEKRDVISRLERLLRAKGLRVKSLRSKVKALEREAWIADNGPDLDVCLSHPALVETGLDFFDSKRTYNFPTLMFYQTGYEPFVLRQAGGRAYRIGQWEPCETFYFFYKGTMQSRAMSLMAKKIAASKSIEGKFDTDGLVSLAGDYGTMEMELAKSLVDQLQLTKQGA